MNYTSNQKKVITRLLNNAKGRSQDVNNTKGKTCEFTLTREWIEATLEAQGHICPRTGITYEYDEYKSWHKRSGHPNRPSINRLNPAKGYTEDNCEIVSNYYNTMLSSWTRTEVWPHVLGTFKHMAAAKGTFIQRVVAWFL